MMWSAFNNGEEFEVRNELEMELFVEAFITFGASCGLG